jgi:hypothetical protein
MPTFQYDVAISFLAADESLATQLCAALEPQLKVFLYSKAQEKLAGTDGEKTFNKVFAEEARVVVVLYRSNWGDTPWTRIEQTAVRNRAFDHGYDFALFVPLDTKPSVPAWLPKNRIWIGLDRWGVKGAASVIDARVQELGGEPKTETLEEIAARLERKTQFAQFRGDYARSYEGVQAANASATEVVQQVATRAESLHSSAPTLGITVRQQRNMIAVLATGPALLINWRLQYANSFDGAKLEATIWKGHPPMPGVTIWDREPHPLKSLKAVPDVDESRQFAWSVQKNAATELMNAQQVASHFLEWWLEKSAK